MTGSKQLTLTGDPLDTDYMEDRLTKMIIDIHDERAGVARSDAREALKRVEENQGEDKNVVVTVVDDFEMVASDIPEENCFVAEVIEEQTANARDGKIGLMIMLESGRAINSVVDSEHVEVLHPEGMRCFGCELQHTAYETSEGCVRDRGLTFRVLRTKCMVCGERNMITK